jgi:hypothetical protein
MICVKNSMPTRPKMMDGIPVSVSAANSITAETLRFTEYSVRYTAAPTPSGRTMTIATRMIYSVLSMLGSMPMVFFI